MKFLSDKSELIFAAVFLILFSMLVADVTHALSTTDIHSAVASIVSSQGGAQ